ncbi:hypothetical protein PIB30_061630, partial [Stylosanthes scabra]|nr:hypothetical protein [Stylosanthes scabra]
MICMQIGQSLVELWHHRFQGRKNLAARDDTNSSGRGIGDVWLGLLEFDNDWDQRPSKKIWPFSHHRFFFFFLASLWWYLWWWR